jgi:hypothetical protein
MRAKFSDTSYNHISGNAKIELCLNRKSDRYAHLNEMHLSRVAHA